MEKTSIDHIFHFLDLLSQFRAIERKVLIKGSDRRENDVEHSFSLAMLAWYVNNTYDLNLSTDKILKYALAHDLVEIYAGDTPFYHTSQEMIDSKQEREEKAALRLKEELSEFPELHEAIEAYEKKSDAESIFIYALDKIEPVLSIYQDNGRSWKRHNVTLDMLITMKTPKVALHRETAEIFEELVSKIKEKQHDLFGVEKLQKPTVLYHASSNRNIELFEPRSETRRDSSEGPQIFATPDKRLASVFIVNTDDSWANSGTFNDVPYMVISDKNRFVSSDKGGAIYTLPVDSFINDPSKGLGELEWTSSESVQSVGKEEYNSGLEAMLESGVQLYFTDNDTYANIQKAVDHGFAILRSLESENKIRNINSVDF